TTVDRVAPRMLQATISAEDRRFLQHFGVDPIAVARALANTSAPSGASTITQQLARRLYLADDSSPLAVRKVHEALIALQLEANRSKAEILQLYLNDVYYGRGAYGVEAAARVYFGIGAANLDLAHAAYLAGLPQRPSDYDSVIDAAAHARQTYVLGRMVDDGWITQAQADAASAELIEILPASLPPIAHQFVAFARAELARLRPDLAGRDGLVIETTLDAGLQSESERLVRLRLATLRGALASSLNIPAVRTLNAIGIDAMLEITHRFGLSLDNVESYGLSLTLGSGEVRLVDLTNAYAAIAGAGQLAEPFAIARVR